MLTFGRVMATVLQLLLFSSSPLLMKASPSLTVNGSSVQMKVVRTHTHTHDKATRVANTLATRQACVKVAVLLIRSESNRSINWIHTVFVNVHGTSHKKSTELMLKGLAINIHQQQHRLGSFPLANEVWNRVGLYTHAAPWLFGSWLFGL